MVNSASSGESQIRSLRCNKSASSRIPLDSVTHNNGDAADTKKRHSVHERRGYRVAIYGVSVVFADLNRALRSAFLVCLAIAPTSYSGAQPSVLSTVVDIGSAQIEVRSQGSGGVLVVLSGVGGDVSNLDFFGRTVADQGLRVLAVNPRGVGDSRGPLSGLSLTDYAEDVAGVLQALGISEATILGFGGGNRVARRLAVIRPDLVDGLVLAAAGGLVPGDPEALALMQVWARGEAPAQERLAAFRASMLSPATDPEPFDPPVVDPVGFEAQMAALNATPLEDWWSGGSAEMLVLQGEDDLIAPAGNGLALKAEFGERVTLVNIPRAGHMLLVEQPVLVVEELLKFIARPRD